MEAVKRLSVEEWVAAEQAAGMRYEFVHGHIRAMSGGTPVHGQLVSNIHGLLFAALTGKPCRVFTSDTSVALRHGNYVYPDATVVCAPPIFTEAPDYSLLNPTVVVEVTSPSTGARDRGWKFAQYQALPSIQHVVFVEADRVAVDVFTRQEDGGWLLRPYPADGQLVRLAQPDLEISIDRLYEGVDPATLDLGPDPSAATDPEAKQPS